MEKDAVILLVGNHVPLMGSISQRLEREPRFSMLGIAQTPEAALATLAQQPADAVLIDIDMRENRWPIVAKEINTVRPDISIVFLRHCQQIT
jgi:DNA-binding NarL/FixJ family response regulator